MGLDGASVAAPGFATPPLSALAQIARAADGPTAWATAIVFGAVLLGIVVAIVLFGRRRGIDRRGIWSCIASRRR